MLPRIPSTQSIAGTHTSQRAEEKKETEAQKRVDIQQRTTLPADVVSQSYSVSAVVGKGGKQVQERTVSDSSQKTTHILEQQLEAILRSCTTEDFSLCVGNFTISPAGAKPVTIDAEVVCNSTKAKKEEIPKVLRTIYEQVLPILQEHISSHDSGIANSRGLSEELQEQLKNTIQDALMEIIPYHKENIKNVVTFHNGKPVALLTPPISENSSLDVIKGTMQGMIKDMASTGMLFTFTITMGEDRDLEKEKELRIQAHRTQEMKKDIQARKEQEALQAEKDKSDIEKGEMHIKSGGSQDISSTERDAG